MVTNCSGERSFSRLKRIKNEARSTMSQERLSDLSILSIESDKLRTLNFADIIDDFAAKKGQEKALVAFAVNILGKIFQCNNSSDSTSSSNNNNSNDTTAATST